MSQKGAAPRMNGSEFSITIEGASMLVKLRGEVDMATAPELSGCLNTLRGDAVVDCSGLDFIDSTGIRAFIEANKAFRARGDRLTLRNLPIHIRRVFGVAGILEVLDVE